jgi:hypothetical protein
MCPQSRSPNPGREKNPVPLPGDEFWFLTIPACVTIPTELSRRRNRGNISTAYIFFNFYFVFCCFSSLFSILYSDQQMHVHRVYTWPARRQHQHTENR